MNEPLWSVTIPTYNAAEYLEQTLKSVLNQGIDVEKMEIIVVDNCSTDNTAEIVKSVGGSRIKLFVNDKNLGAFGNFNRCVEVASGEFIHLLNADDLIKPGFYQKVEEAFAQYPQVHLVCCNADFINENSVITGPVPVPTWLAQPTNDISEMLYRNPLLTPAVVVKKSAYEQLGGFDIQFKFVGDWEMWARVTYNLGAFCIPDVLAEYRVHSQSTTSNLHATGADMLDFEKIFTKFSQLGYPINEEKKRKRLSDIAKYYYELYVVSGNEIGAKNMMGLYERSTSKVDALMLASKVGLKKLLDYNRKKG